MKPLLSICIPTYNRAEYLMKSLESIVNQDNFNEEVEVVISDNASTDDTEKVSMEFCQRYSNIKYFKNKENLMDKNHPLALKRATGILRKLSNDSLMYNEGALGYIIDAIKNNLKERPVLFFLASGKQKEDIYVCEDLNIFTRYTSFNMTWIGSIAYWEDDCMDLRNYEEDSSSRLPQVPHLLECVAKKNRAVVFDKKILSSQPVNKKNLSYGLFQVFYLNFLGFLNEYVKRNSISMETYEYVKKDLLFNFFLGWVIEFKRNNENYILGSEDLIACIDKAYKKESYYNWFKIRLFINFQSIRIKKFFSPRERIDER